MKVITGGIAEQNAKNTNQNFCVSIPYVHSSTSQVFMNP
jgi:hypothetical protein